MKKPEIQHRPKKYADDYMEPHADFDLAAVLRSLGEPEDCEAANGHSKLAGHDVALLAQALCEVLRWITTTKERGGVRLGADTQIGRRAIVLEWCISPALIEDSPSLRAIAERLGLSGATMLSRHAIEARQRFGIHNRAQAAHDWRHQIGGTHP